MNVNEPTGHSAAEDLSDRSNSSNSESQLHAFQDYGKIKELNLSINKAKDPLVGSKLKDFSFTLDGGLHHGLSFGVLAAEKLVDDLPASHRDKDKEFDIHSEKIKDISNYSLDRSEDLDTSLEIISNLQSRPKDNKVAVFNFDAVKDTHFSREPRDTRKNIHFPVDRSKDLNFPKAYNHPLDRIKDFNFALDRRRETHAGGIPLERLRGGSFLEPADYRNAQIQPRDELEAMAIERMRRSHVLTLDIAPRNLPAHLQPQPLSITEIQHSQQQQQQQGKSFTIDSILGLQNNQRDKQQRNQQHPYRKNQGQESSAKNGSSGSSLVRTGKLKRVRTIFTAEQLERLEGEFARQQYMVGPERLYLAHALRLTEAQVKVWFQNRRIKWRKLHLEQQSQRLHELLALPSPEQDVEDSNENGECQEAFKPDYPKAASSGHLFLSEPETTTRTKSRILDTISEHTEPSPTPSATMDQVEMEAQSLQARRPRRGRHGASSYWPNWASRLPADGTTASDSYWKASPRPIHSVSHSHEQRKHDYGATEPVTSCYSASNTYRPKPRAVASTLPKTSHVVPNSEQTHRTSQHGSRTARNKLLTTNNIAVVRKPCYKEDLEEDEELKYADEDVNYGEENAEEEVADEADEEQDETFEYNEKDYEEQEADDEVDDESDAFQAQLHRGHHKGQKLSNHRVQNLRHPDQQQDLRRLQRPQNPLKIYQDQKLSRYYSHGPDPHQETSYGDAGEAINSEDEPTPPLTPPRRSSRRTSETSHNAVPTWMPARKSLERNRAPLQITPHLHQRHQRLSNHSHLEQQQQQQQQQHHQQQNRHQPHQHNQLRRSHRVCKPEIESLMMPESASPAPGPKKCCICGGSTVPVTMRVGSPKKGSCRLHEYRGLSIKGPPGEDGEAEEQVVCPRCVKRHNMEDLRSGCEAVSAPEAVPIYTGKPHRSRVHRPSSYDCPEESVNVDEMLAAYVSSGQPRASVPDYSAVPRERTRHSVQTAKSPLRRGSYWER